MSERAVRGDVVAHDEVLRRVGVVDVERREIRRERQAVGAIEIAHDRLHPAVREAIDAVERELLGRIVILLGEAVGRISEVQRAVLREHQVVRAVEALAFERDTTGVSVRSGATRAICRAPCCTIHTDPSGA